jgi:hypothetical protein
MVYDIIIAALITFWAFVVVTIIEDICGNPWA